MREGQASRASRGAALVRDELTQTMEQSWDVLFSLDRPDVEAFQLKGAQQRFEELLPRIRVLKAQADANGVASIKTLNDVVPVLFQHTVNKSYPLSLIEKNRFDMLTRWLDGLTAVDLSSIDASQCEGIDDWLDTLERQTPLQMYHTSGTTGKLSFLPRTTLERDMWNEMYARLFEGFTGDTGPNVKVGRAGMRMPAIYPSYRYGRYVAQRLVKWLSENVAPTPEQCYTLTNGTLSADLVSLAGRIRVAQAKGELSKMKLTEGMRVALKRYIEEQQRQPEEMSNFFIRMQDQLCGQRVLITGLSSYLLQATEEAERRNVSGVFASDSLATYGGGGKGVVLPEGWIKRLARFTGIEHWINTYAMTEINCLMPSCSKGHFHIEPFLVPFLLDPLSGEPLPRHGRRMGRFAVLDLTAQNYWGGIISGDKVTIEWDTVCGCGRKGAYVLDSVERYDESVTGDDKITCAATIDNTDTALHQLLSA